MPGKTFLDGRICVGVQSYPARRLREACQGGIIRDRHHEIDDIVHCRPQIPQGTNSLFNTSYYMPHAAAVIAYDI